MSNGPIEPSADLRASAKHLRQIYIALELEGFTERQALGIIGMMLAVGDGNAGES